MSRTGPTFSKLPKSSGPGVFLMKIHKWSPGELPKPGKRHFSDSRVNLPTCGVKCLIPDLCD